MIVDLYNSAVTKAVIVAQATPFPTLPVTVIDAPTRTAAQETAQAVADKIGSQAPGSAGCAFIVAFVGGAAIASLVMSANKLFDLIA